MLQKLSIKNFQKHKHLEIKFDKHITTIVGANDVGKSAVIRALHWVCNNSPSGDAFIRDGASSATVQLKVDKKKITRTKGKSQNLYSVDGKQYKAFGSNVPEPVQAILNVTDFNFQSQHDPAFWLSDTAGKVSQNLNQVIDLGAIDRSLQNIASTKRKIASEKSVVEKRLKESQQQTKRLSWSEKAVELISKIERKRQNIEKHETQLAQIQDCLEEHETAKHEKKRLTNLIKAGNKANKIAKHIQSKQDCIDTIESILSNLSKCQKTKTKLKKKIKQAQKKINLQKRCPLCKQKIESGSV